MSSEIRGPEDGTYVSLLDPATKTVWLVDTEAMASKWACIYGDGCKGNIRGTKPEQGCCTRGVHVDGDDIALVNSVLQDERVWDYVSTEHFNEETGWLVFDGDLPSTYAESNDGCVFLGDDGCQLHHYAVGTGQNPEDVKPFVCWQAPFLVDPLGERGGWETKQLRFMTQHDWISADDSPYEDRLTTTDTNMQWWCIDAPEAQVSEEPVYISEESVLRKLMGDQGYTVMRNAMADLESTPVQITKKKS